MPTGSGLAYVVIQHLDPTHKGMLPELLARFTKMPVAEVKGQMKVRPDHVYVIPPNRDLSILRGTLFPVEPDSPRGLRLPIDRFLRALAEQQPEASACVILSGMGSDGSLGLQAIHESAGLVLVQDPAQAAFDGMPRSAIATGMVDVVAPAEELPGRLVAAFRSTTPAPAAASRVEEADRASIDRILALLRTRSGHDFSRYKTSSVSRRIERRMGIHQLDTLESYARYVREQPKELDILFKELLIGVTSFFRDPAAWAFMKAAVIPTLLAEHPEGAALRAWVPACSTGEEAYTLAMLFHEVLEAQPSQARHSLQIFATDLDPDAISKARRGIYPANIQADVGLKRLERFFYEEGSGYRLRAQIRDMVTFAPQDVLLDPPFTKLDIVSCRNLLIYLEPDLQQKLINLFHYSLNPGGVLFLGTAETLASQDDLFVPMDPKHRVFRRREAPLRAGAPAAVPAWRFPIFSSAKDEAPATLPAPDLATLADQALLQHFCPAAVLVTGKGDIVYISGRTGKYLEPATGQANWNIHAMARDGLRSELTSALRKAQRQDKPVLLHGITVGTNGGTQVVDVRVEAISEPEQLRGMVMVVFTDVPGSDKAKAGGRSRRRAPAMDATAERAIREAREESRRLYEDMQTAQEELKSANEELQSINEELTTSKEEMQSMNEELQTVNAELQSKVDELTRTSNDMKNLLDSTDIATIFLDAKLNVRRFTPHATELFKLLPGDVSRPLSDIVTQLEYPELEQDVRDVLRTLVYCEKEVPASDERWFKVRVMPYRTLDNVIDGVVITFSNITGHKLVEARLREKIGQA